MAAEKWIDYDSVRINVASWPPSEPIDSSQLHTRWPLTTFAAISPGQAHQIQQLDLSTLVRSMSLEVRLVGERMLEMSCVYDAQLPAPSRLGAISVAWRLIDENIARLWMIGDALRATYPAFQRQRRELVEQLSPPCRQLWIWMSLLRAEPLIALLAGRPSIAEKLTHSVRVNPPGPLLVSTLHRWREETEGLGARPRPLSCRTDVHELGSLLAEATRSALGGVSSDSVDLTCYAAERLLDAWSLIDRAADDMSTECLAAFEDVTWHEDCLGLREPGDDAYSTAADRTARFLSRWARRARSCGVVDPNR